jgi:hypothetical protein
MTAQHTESIINLTLIIIVIFLLLLLLLLLLLIIIIIIITLFLLPLLPLPLLRLCRLPSLPHHHHLVPPSLQLWAEALDPLARQPAARDLLNSNGRLDDDGRHLALQLGVKMGHEHRQSELDDYFW